MDPIIGAGVVAKAVDGAASEAGKAAGGLVQRAFGPAADQIGAALGQYTEYRMRNLNRIAEKAERKAQGREGSVSPRVAYSVLEDGSFCDDELMAEYLGGVLAAGRTPSGRDDRAITWSKLITSMSALQLRTHFVLYREWAHALHGNTELSLTTDRERALMYVNLDDLLAILAEVAPDVPTDAVVTDLVTGLFRFNLVSDTDYFLGSAEAMAERRPAEARSPFRNVFTVYPEITGLTLYGWACGLTGFDPALFSEREELLAENVDVARPAVLLPNLPSPRDTDEPPRQSTN